MRPIFSKLRIMNKNKNILITGASGKTGKTIINHLSSHQWMVTAFTHKESYRQELLDCGAKSVMIGDLRSINDLENALAGVNAMYHICPNMTEDELAIGKNAIHACQNAGVKRFIYHSVLHPHIQSMPHHWQKLLVEEELFKSSLEYTILQPTAYMQNLLGYKNSILEGKFPIPYSPQAEISLVDLRNVAEVVLHVLTNIETTFGIYEIVGTLPISQVQVAAELSDQLGKTISVEVIEKSTWESSARQSGMPDYSRKTLLSMFEYYDKYGLKGSPETLSFLLNKKPITIAQFIKDHF